MKILHTSDWHLGHVLYGYDRTDEQQSMLDQMVKIAKEEKPDLFLVSGDVYHTAEPKPAVQKMFNKAVANLCKACPDMTIVVTAGNHDSGTKHEIFKTPWEALNVHMIGKFDKDNLESHIIEIPGKGYVIALPFTNDRYLPEDIYQQLIDMTNQKNADNLPVVFSAHTAISGMDFAGHEDVSDKRVGGVDVMDVTKIGDGYDYLALGHIHKPQFLHTGKHNVRYSGSPMAASFDDDTKVFGKWEEVCAQYENYSADTKAYIRLNITDPEAMPSNAYDKAVKQAEDKEYLFCFINAKRRTSERDNGIQQQMTVEEFQATDPWEVVQMYAADTNSVLFDEKIMQPLFDEVLESLKTKEE